MKTALTTKSNGVNSATSAASTIQCSDERLVEAAKGGSELAIEQLIVRYQNKLFHVARSIARSREDAEEVTQDAFVQAFKNLSRFRGDSRFYTWLVRITINAGLMRLRGRRVNVFSFDDAEGQSNIRSREIEDCGTTPEQSCLQHELRQILDTSIGQLPSGYRSVFELCAVQGFSTKETACALNLSSTAVKTRLRRARLRMRQSVAQHLKAAHRKSRYRRWTFPAAVDFPPYRNTGLSGEPANTTTTGPSE